MIRTGLFRYVRHADLDAFMRAGWMVVGDLGPQHGQYAVLCWRCDCNLSFGHQPKGATGGLMPAKGN